ncbi:dihydrodipicolinate reductase [Roseivivax sediminis]|uniref:Dihydrodipicolinate reductase n=1 Tax=Roseivivax sediminis TaxID=936889 RepID=A0A1I1UPV1_9RHOB|nr:dihydrodipicolinate reductase [Roseivivax sediminis]SFD72872.1 hypothetical protein SAMN04515678_102460 [Roseivivax sediminis]
MIRTVSLGAAMAAMLAGAVGAEPAKVDGRGEFLDLVQGRTLSRPLVSLQVGADGSITGSGAGWDVTGSWTWQDGYFCRDINWGGDDLGYNCQLVTVDDGRITFVEDRGAGRSAGFSID